MNDLNGKKVQYDVKNLQYLVSSAFDKLIRFLDELKYDYINCKEQNVRYLTDNLNRNGNLGEGMLFINDETNKMKKIQKNYVSWKHKIRNYAFCGSVVMRSKKRFCVFGRADDNVKILFVLGCFHFCIYLFFTK